MKSQDNLIHPEDNSNINYWTRKFGVSIHQLNDAILYTGSLNPGKVREYLKKDVWYHLPFFGLNRLFRNNKAIIN